MPPDSRRLITEFCCSVNSPSTAKQTHASQPYPYLLRNSSSDSPVRLSLTSCTTLDGERAATVGLAMFVRLRRRGRGLHENFLGWGLLGGVPSFFRFEGEGDHIGRFECLVCTGQQS